jgi:hypothetical protein
LLPRQASLRSACGVAGVGRNLRYQTESFDFVTQNI